MGYLRFFLAIGVLIHHAPGIFSIVNGGLAVEIFFAISGYYMAMVYEKKYNGRPFVFYTNRLIRLLPTYYLVIAIQFIIILTTGYGTDTNFVNWQDLKDTSEPTFWALAGMNIMPIGQEWASFLSLTSSGVIESNGIAGSGATPTWQFLLAPQSWSISIEILFYLFVPALTKSRSILISVALLSFCAHKISIHSGVDYNSWGRRFFPLLIHFFLGGMVVFHLGQKYQDWIARRSMLFAMILLAFVPLFTIALRTPNDFAILYGYPIATIYTTAILPIIFKKLSSDFESYLGQLSYPIYMTHAMVLAFVSKSLNLPHGFGFIVTVAITLLLSHIIYKFIEKPLDRIRQVNATSKIIPKKEPTNIRAST
ncbi:MAG: acyltransferase [Aquabacterium sp.]|nr:acyltransferase [Aquabacterium sp.]